jgi:hypothetical protein
LVYEILYVKVSVPAAGAGTLREADALDVDREAAAIAARPKSV